MEGVGDGLGVVELPGVSYLDQNGVCARLERRINVATHAVADHPGGGRVGHTEFIEEQLKLGSSFVLANTNALHGKNAEYTGCLDAAELVARIARHRVEGGWRLGGEAREGRQGAIKYRGHAGDDAAESGGALGQDVIHGAATGLAESFISRSKRMLHSCRAQAELAPHHGIDLVVMYTMDIDFGESRRCQEPEQLAPCILKARRGVHEGVVEVDED